jgi:hypothetical protein
MIGGATWECLRRRPGRITVLGGTSSTFCSGAGSIAWHRVGLFPAAVTVKTRALGAAQVADRLEGRTPRAQ